MPGERRAARGTLERCTGKPKEDTTTNGDRQTQRISTNTERCPQRASKHNATQHTQYAEKQQNAGSYRSAASQGCGRRSAGGVGNCVITTDAANSSSKKKQMGSSMKGATDNEGRTKTQPNIYADDAASACCCLLPSGIFSVVLTAQTVQTHLLEDSLAGCGGRCCYRANPHGSYRRSVAQDALHFRCLRRLAIAAAAARS